MPNVSALPALCLYILQEEFLTVMFPESFKFLAIYLWPLYSKVLCGWTVNQFGLTKTSPSPSFPTYLNLASVMVFIFCSFSISTVINKCKLNNLKLQNFYSYNPGGQKSTVKTTGRAIFLLRGTGEIPFLGLAGAHVWRYSACQILFYS